MSSVNKDEYGFVTTDDHGYIFRGPEYEARFLELERISGGVSGWRREGTGFTTVYPANSAAHRRIIEGIASKIRAQEKSERRSQLGSDGAITAKSTPKVGRHDPWDCDDWIVWHRALVADLGDQEADRLWRNAWLDVRPAPIDPRMMTAEFRSYVAMRPTLARAVHTMSSGAPAAQGEIRVGEVSNSSSGIPLGALAVAGLIGGGLWLWWRRKGATQPVSPPIPVMMPMYLPGGPR